MILYKTQLKKELKTAKERYHIALNNYTSTSISDPLWEEVRRNRDLAYLDYQTAKSRLNNLSRPSSVEEYKIEINTSTNNNKQQ